MSYNLNRRKANREDLRMKSDWKGWHVGLGSKKTGEGKRRASNQ